MSLTIDDETVRLAETLAARLRVDKVEAIRVAFANAVRRHEAAQANAEKPHPPQDRGPEADPPSDLP